MGTTPRGVRIFIMLSAVVVSDAEDGYLEVMYNGGFPRDNPLPRRARRHSPGIR
jgi:hypothetical protein